MRILHTVEFYDPSKGGSEEVVRQISEALVQRGHDVTVATSYDRARNAADVNGVHIRQFQIRGNSVKGIVGDLHAYQNLVLDSTFDAILNYGAQTWSTDAVFPLLPGIKAHKYIVPLGYSKLHQARYARYFATLPHFLKLYDRIIYTSEGYQDKDFGDRHGLSGKAVVIPNGADIEEFNISPLGFRDRFGITTQYMFLTVANHYFAKGHAFVLDALSLLRREDCSLVIVGDAPRDHFWYSCYPACAWAGLRNKKIKILKNVPREWVVSAFLEADLFLFGSRVECSPLVMYESFAARLPFITTNVGNVKDHREHLWVVENPRSMTQTIERYLDDHLPFKERADRAYRDIALERTWKKISMQYLALYESGRT